jgi:hypothetical protein
MVVLGDRTNALYITDRPKLLDFRRGNVLIH